MRCRSIVVVVVVALAGCASTPPPAAPIASAAPAEDVVAAVEGFHRDMCACHAGDPACARKVQRALGDFNDAHRDARVPYRDVKRLAKLEKDTEACAQHATHEDLMAVMMRFKDAMCACTAGDKDCAMRVQQDMEHYAESRHDLDDMKMSDEDMKRATDIGMAMAKCSAAAMGMGSGANP